MKISLGFLTWAKPILHRWKCEKEVNHISFTTFSPLLFVSYLLGHPPLVSLSSDLVCGKEITIAKTNILRPSWLLALEHLARLIFLTFKPNLRILAVSSKLRILRFYSSQIMSHLVIFFLLLVFNDEYRSEILSLSIESLSSSIIVVRGI